MFYSFLDHVSAPKEIYNPIMIAADRPVISHVVKTKRASDFSSDTAQARF